MHLIFKGALVAQERRTAKNGGEYCILKFSTGETIFDLTSSVMVDAKALFVMADYDLTLDVKSYEGRSSFKVTAVKGGSAKAS